MYSSLHELYLFGKRNACVSVCIVDGNSKDRRVVLVNRRKEMEIMEEVAAVKVLRRRANLNVISGAKVE